MNEGKIESMLSQLIRMVGSMQSDQQGMKQVQLEMKQEQLEMKLEQLELSKRIQNMETKVEVRHEEILEHLKVLKMDQELIWEKISRNETEIGILKKQFDHQLWSST